MSMNSSINQSSSVFPFDKKGKREKNAATAGAGTSQNSSLSNLPSFAGNRKKAGSGSTPAFARLDETQDAGKVRPINTGAQRRTAFSTPTFASIVESPAEVLSFLARATSTPPCSVSLSPASPQENSCQQSRERSDWNLAKLGHLALSSGNLIDAMHYFQRQFDQAKRAGYPEDIAEASTDLAYILVLSGAKQRAGLIYATALSAWLEVSPRLAVKSPKVISAFALFLHDYGAFLAMRNNLILAARAKRRLELLANRFSSFTIYSALAKRMRERGQQREAKMMLDRARPNLVNKTQAAYTKQLLQNIRTYEEATVFLPPVNFSVE